MGLLAAGCSTTRVGLPPQPAKGPSPAYRIGCPDVLDVSFRNAPDRDVLSVVDVDGRLSIPGVGKPRVEGLTVAEATSAIAEAAGVRDSDVVVQVDETRRSHVTVSGPDNRRSRMLAYAGPEPVVDFLRRTETLPAVASKLNRVYVLRSNIAAGTEPRLYHIDIEAIVYDGDQSTNLALEPGDRIYIGETRRSSLARLLPDWAMPLYRKLVGLLPEALR